MNHAGYMNTCWRVAPRNGIVCGMHWCIFLLFHQYACQSLRDIAWFAHGFFRINSTIGILEKLIACQVQRLFIRKRNTWYSKWGGLINSPFDATFQCIREWRVLHCTRHLCGPKEMSFNFEGGSLDDVRTPATLQESCMVSMCVHW